MIRAIRVKIKEASGAGMVNYDMVDNNGNYIFTNQNYTVFLNGVTYSNIDPNITNVTFATYPYVQIPIVSSLYYLIGGDFTSAGGDPLSRMTIIDSSGLVPSFSIGSGFNGPVYSHIQDTNGKYVVVGGFTSYNGTSANYIIRLNSDGTVDNTFNTGTGFDNFPQTIVQDTSGRYLISGQFTSYNLTSINRIIRLNSDGTVDNTFSSGTGFNGSAQVVLRDTNGKYVISGYFTNYNGNSRNHIIRLNSDGTIDNTFNVGTGLSSYSPANSIIQDTNGKYVIGGWFTSYNGVSKNRIIRLNSDGSVDNTFNIGTGFGGVVFTIIQDTNGKYVIGGNFTGYNGTSVNGIIRLNSDGSIDNTFNSGTGFNNYVFTIIQDTNGKYVVGGGFTNYNGTSAGRIIRLNSNGSIDNTLVKFSNIVNTIIQNTNGEYVVSGQFTFVNINESYYIISETSTGSIDNTFNTGTGFNSSIYAIVKDTNGKYVVGGVFTSYNGTAANYIIRLNSDGSVDNTFSIGTGFDNYVITIIQDTNGKYVIGGWFTDYNGTAANYIIRLNSDGSVDNTFSSGTGFDSYTQTIIQDTNGKYVVGGNFTGYDGNSANYIIRLNSDGSVDSTFNIGTGFDNSVNTIIQDANGKYMVGGYFSSYDWTISWAVVRLNSDGSIDNTFAPIGPAYAGGPGSLQTIIQDTNGKYILGGFFDAYESNPINNIIRINSSGTKDETFNVGSGFNDVVFSVKQDTNGKYVVGGWFTSYNGTDADSITVLDSSGAIDTGYVSTGLHSVVHTIIIK